LVCCTKKNLATLADSSRHLETEIISKLWATTRVTLNQGVQIGVVFTLGIFKIVTNFTATYSKKKVCINFVKNGLGYILGIFSIKSSGHSALNRERGLRQIRPSFNIRGRDRKYLKPIITSDFSPLLLLWLLHQSHLKYSIYVCV
jgi:hypothetical protein